MTYTYPGVYIQELPSPVHAIAGVATSTAAFVGYTSRGIDNRAREITSFSDFERLYGGISPDSELSYAVAQFFQNGGTTAYVVRTPSHGALAANVTFNTLEFEALSTGTWANGKLIIDVDFQGLDPTLDAFNLTITDLADQTSEYFPNVSLLSTKNNYFVAIVNDPDSGSQLVKAIPPPTSPTLVNATGTIGFAITPALVNGLIGESLHPTVASADFGLDITTNKPATPPSGLPLPVKLFGQGTPIPQTLVGLATQLQQALNASLAVAMPGASVKCSVEPTSATDFGIRVNALIPQVPDAVIEFHAPSLSSLSDARQALGFLPQAPPFPSPLENVAHYTLGTNNAFADQASSGLGSDGSALPGAAEILGDPGQFTGIYALDRVDLFNLLCIPDATRAQVGHPSTPDLSSTDYNAIFSAAISLCDRRRAFVLIDPPPDVVTVSSAVDWKTSHLTVVDPNGAAFFPRLRLPDPANDYQLRTFAPCGVVAGLYARIDATRGVWKAPAGTEATLSGVQSMTYKLTDLENGLLNPLGVNCCRMLPLYGPVLWGARTLVGADAMTSQWKYVPVRRMALFIEESLYRGTKWVVFEPNDEPLWASIRLNIEAFMQTLFLKHAFQGQTPDQAYFVKCDSDTTTQADIDNGIVNILVGFAPLKPAEFVVIQIEQLAGQVSP